MWLQGRVIRSFHALERRCYGAARVRPPAIVSPEFQVLLPEKKQKKKKEQGTFSREPPRSMYALLRPALAARTVAAAARLAAMPRAPAAALHAAARRLAGELVPKSRWH